MKQPCVYMLANKKDGVLYTGVTSNIVKRIWEHKNNSVKGFTQKYNVHGLVWFELHENMDVAIAHEKKLKNWQRDWKIKLIEKNNPEWIDLYSSIC